jgi:hypothetical protein
MSRNPNDRKDPDGTNPFIAPNNTSSSIPVIKYTSYEHLNDEESSRDFINSSDDENEIDLTKSPSSVPLIPFTNQVGGHAPFLRFSEKAICKPFNQRENDFYQSIDMFNPELKEFTPIYLGLVNVTYPNHEVTSPAKSEGETTVLGVKKMIKTPSTPEVVLEKNRHIFANMNSRVRKSSHQRSKSTDAAKSRLETDRRTSSAKHKKESSFDEESSQILTASTTQSSLDESFTEGAHNTSFADVSEDVRRFQLKVFKEALSPQTRRTWEENHRNSVIEMLKDFQRTITVNNGLESVFETNSNVESNVELNERKSRRNSIESPLETKSKAVPIKEKKIEPHNGHSSSCPTNCFLTQTPDEKKAAGPSEMNQFYNPWSLQTYRNMFNKITSNGSSSFSSINDTHQFLMLQDLTDGLKYPCILDLKMGTRQYGIEASTKKRESQMKKAAATTSASLGVRVCGMQVYQIHTGKYFFQDKYDGRNLSEKQFKTTILKFLHNGQTVLYHFIPFIINRLKLLYCTIEKLPKYRFYSSSLLFLYDGYFENDYEEKLQEEPLKDQVAWDIPGQMYSKNTAVRKLRKVSVEEYEKRKIDIRIIDFAHSVSPLNYEKSVEVDPETFSDSVDTGYLKGILSLIDTLTEILQGK